MSNRRVAFGALALAAGNLVKVGLQLVMLPLMARLLGPEEYGLYSLTMPVFLFTTTLADGGLGTSLAREPETNTAVWSSAFWALLISGLVMAGLVSASSFVLAMATHQPRLPPIMSALTLSLIFFVLSVPANARLARRVRLEFGALGDSLGAALGAGCAVILALGHAGAWSLVAQTTVAYATRCAVANLAAPMAPSFHFSLRDLTAHLTMGGTIIGGKLVDTSDRSIENALMSRNFGTAQLGTYSIATQIASFLCGAISNVFWATLYSQTVRANDEASVVRSFRRLLRAEALILFPLAALVAAEGEPLIHVFLGSKWVSLSPMLQIFLIAYALSAIGVVGQALLYARGVAGLQFRLTVETAVLRVAFVAAAPWIGILGLIAGITGIAVYTFGRNIISICRNLNVSVLSILAELVWPAASSITVGFACWRFSISQSPSIESILKNILLGIISYLLIIFLIERNALKKDISDIIALTRR